MTTNPTSLLKLSRPNFNSSTWHDDVNNNMVIIDAALRSIGVFSDIRGIWLNSTAYEEGDKVVDPVTESLWRCETSHTSSPTGTLAEEVAANPTYWRPVSQGLLPRGNWTTATQYYVNDLVYANGGTLVLGALVEHVSGTLLTDIASGYWFPIFDLTVGGLVTETGIQTLTNKTLDDPDLTGTVSIYGDDDQVLEVREDSDSATGVQIQTYHNSASPAANDTAAMYLHYANSSTGVQRTLFREVVKYDDPTNASEDASVQMAVISAGTLTDILYLGRNAANTATAGVVGLPLGKLSFPATAAPSSDANTLDDYEKGTWTPTVTPTSGSITTYSAAGRYIKIGGVVVCTISIFISNNGTGSGGLNFTTPFVGAYALSGAGSLREGTVTGLTSTIQVTSGGGSLFTYSNGYPGGNGHTLDGGFAFFA